MIMLRAGECQSPAGITDRNRPEGLSGGTQRIVQQRSKVGVLKNY
jgi:hypothetical protein